MRYDNRQLLIAAVAIVLLGFLLKSRLDNQSAPVAPEVRSAEPTPPNETAESALSPTSTPFPVPQTYQGTAITEAPPKFATEWQNWMNETRARWSKAMTNPDDAASAMKWLGSCIVNTEDNEPFPQMPKDFLARLPENAKNQITINRQAGCIGMAYQLAKKFPALANQFESNIVKLARPEAVELARKSLAVSSNRDTLNQDQNARQQSPPPNAHH